MSTVKLYSVVVFHVLTHSKYYFVEANIIKLMVTYKIIENKARSENSIILRNTAVQKYFRHCTSLTISNIIIF